MFEGKQVIDVTRNMQQGMTVWPGDDPVRFWRTAAISEGAIVNVTRSEAGVHAGSHMDAPLHFIDQSKDISSMALDRFFGKVLLVESKEIQISEEILKGYDLSGIQAVFFKTSSSDLDVFSPFQTQYPAITPGCAVYLVEKGIKTVGIDYMSIECCPDNSFQVHHTLLSKEVAIVENLCFKGVEPGIYDYVCLPLKIDGSDGSPVRALLFK